jgi:hypothetical protein
MEHIITIRTSQGTYYISATETNRLMQFGERIAVYCGDHTEHIYSSYLTGNTLGVRYRDRPTGLFCLGKQSLFTVRTVWNT